MNLLSLFGQTSNDIYPVDTANAVTNAIIIGLPIFFAFCLLVSYVLVSYLLSRIFKKAGVTPWKAWVPVYSLWLTLELGDKPGWWAVVLAVATVIPVYEPTISTTDQMFFPFLGLMLICLAASITASVFMYMAMYRIGLKFGKEGYFVLWAIFLPMVWYAWLAFDKSTWNPSLQTPAYTAATPATPKNENSNTPTQNV